MLPSFSILVVLGAAVLYAIIKVLAVGRRDSDLPPGPPTLPVIGNLHLMPSKRPHLQFQKWAQEYGPVYSLILGTRKVIVLSTDEAVKEVLDKRSSNYSDRPDMYIGQKIASGDLRLVVMRYGDKWRSIHKMIHNILNIKAAVTYVPYQDLENKFLLKGFLETPNQFLKHIRRFTYSLSCQMIYGFRFPDFQEPTLQQLFTNFERWGELSGSASAQLSDLYPVLQKLPAAIAPNVRHAQAHFQKERKHYVGHWMRSKQAIDDGTGLPCFCNDIYRAQKEQDFTDDAAAYISGSLLEAGSDTTASTLYAFILACILWPEVQERAREEIDRVVGSDRLPTYDDYANMPYIRCCIKESLRWMPTVVLGIPHAALQDDVYMGYKIPKGAMIINNVWAIHMDPKRSPEPRCFKPDRFANDNTSLYQSAVGNCKKRDNFVFGAGRRLCQGIHIAERSLFLGISRMIWAFEFHAGLDANGKPFQYDVEDLVGGITIQPNDFPAEIKVRSPKKVDLINESVAECNTLLDSATGQWKNIPEGMAFSTWVPDKVNV